MILGLTVSNRLFVVVVLTAGVVVVPTFGEMIKKAHWKQNEL